MKKIISFLILASVLLLLGCEAKAPSQATINITTQQLVLRKMVAVGNSLTMGIESAGIVQDFQMHSYPYLIAQQMGRGSSFQQPLIASPGLGEGGRGPMKFENGTVVPGDPSPANPLTIALNVTLARPYDNLGVSGADLNDVLNTTNGGLFDLVLRNPNFGNTTQIDQALLLNPSLLLLWIGNNDVLGAALSGTAVEGVTITPQAEFQTKFTQLIQKIKTYSHAQIVMANIPDVADIPYVNTIPPIVVDPTTFQPVIVNNQTVPLVTAESNVQYVLLTAFDSLKVGVGIPAAIGGTGRALGGEFTLTADEVTTITNAVNGFNQTLLTLAQQYQIPIVDAHKMLSDLNDGNIAGFSGRFVLLAPTNTAFSLDGVHPNNAGYALVANEFIKVINAAFGSNIPTVDATQYLGQYVSAGTVSVAPGTFARVKDIFVKHN